MSAATDHASTTAAARPPPSLHRPKPASSSSSSSMTGSASPPQAGWFPTPEPIRRLFALFPLQTLPANALPATRETPFLTPSSSYTPTSATEKAPSTSDATTTTPLLHLFTTPSAARTGQPSFNPTCLKWQTWLRARRAAVREVPASNHASPSGQLPFVTVPGGGAEGRDKVLTAGKLLEWGNKVGEEAAPRLETLMMAREEAYVAMVEERVRAAWLYSLYLTPNFYSLVCPLYIDAATSSPPARAALARSLRAAAHSSLHILSPRTTPKPATMTSTLISAAWGSSSGKSKEQEQEEQAAAIYARANAAFEALSTVLGDDDWFFGAAEPGLLDVTLFSYTHLMLDDELGKEGGDEEEEEGRGWVDTQVRNRLMDCGNLVRHRRRLYKKCFT